MSCGSIGGLAKRAGVAHPIVPMTKVHGRGKAVSTHVQLVGWAWANPTLACITRCECMSVCLWPYTEILNWTNGYEVATRTFQICIRAKSSRGYFSAITSAWKEPQGAKMTQVECVRSAHSNFRISLCCECQSDGRVTRLGASHRVSE